MEELAAYFVETDQWRRLLSGDVDVVYGAKGSGKSALYALLNKNEDALLARDILVVSGENPSGAAAFKEVATDPPTSEDEFVALWKAYFLSLIAAVLQDWRVESKEAVAVYKALGDAGLLVPDGSLSARLSAARSFVRQFRPSAVESTVLLDPAMNPVAVTGKITLREPNSELKTSGFISLDDLLKQANDALSDLGYTIWLLLDRLDVAFETHEELEKRALRALFKAYLDIAGARPNLTQDLSAE